MLLSDWSRRIALTAAVMSALSLAACFRPLYGSAIRGNDVRSTLSKIEIKPIADISGHYLREELLYMFNGGTPVASSEAVYTLTVTLTEANQAVALDPSGGRSDAASLSITANYTLKDKAEKTLSEGSLVAAASIDRLAQRFAAVRASREARIRIAKTLADQLDIQLSAYFSSRTP